MIKFYDHDRKFGAWRLDDGSVRFQLWAPAQKMVSVAIEGGMSIPMQRSSDGWFETTSRVAIGSRYRYRLADGQLVPDPAARAQDGDVHGPSIIQDDRFDWKNDGWRGRPWTEVVLYELHPGVAGGFRAIQDDLPRLKELGVTAVELMPVNAFPGERNWGYDGVLIYAPASAYGTPTELKELVDAAHGLGLMVFLDVVYNHFGPDGNYIHAYAPQFFRDDVQTPWGAAIDFRIQEVRNFFTSNVLMWLFEYRIDGLRFDAVHAILEQDWIKEMVTEVRSKVGEGRCVHLVIEHHNNAEHLRNGIDAQWNDDGHNVLHVLLTGETGGYYTDYANEAADKLARVLAEGWVYQGQESSYLDAPRGERSADLPPHAHVLFLQNHDQIGNRAFGERLISLTSAAELRAATALQLLCPQIPLIFMGEETGTRTPFLFFTDHHDELAVAVRNGRRQEFAKFADFADPAKREQIPDPNDIRTFEASIPRRDGPEWFSFYRQLLAIRQTEIIPILEGASSVGSRAIGPRSVLARWQMGNGSILTIILLLDTDAALPATPRGRLLFKTADSSPLTAVYLEDAA